MSLKDNFNQALREVLHKDGIIGNKQSAEDKEKKKTELDSYLEPAPKKSFEEAVPAEKAAEAVPDTNISEPIQTESEPADYSSPDIAPAAAVKSAEEPKPAPEAPQTESVSPFAQYSQFARQSGAAARQDQQQNSAYSGSYGSGQTFGSSNQSFGGSSQSFGSSNQSFGGSNQSFGGGSVPPTPPRPPRSSSFRGNEPDSPYYETEETTVISRNTIIDGNIRSFANINIDGSVKGDVKITKNINVTGKVVGDIECNNSVMTGASMQGNIVSKGQVQMDRDSLILGDISAQYLDLNGKIKGNVDVGGKAEFKTDAVILGNITASTITVLDGATIQGYVNTTFLQESSSSIFPEAIALSE
ncbi:MAG: polymer-forming cytoskeletal protein [Oscillospiraceae bacterium]